MQIVAAEKDPNVRKLIEAAKNEPVMLLDDGEPAAVVVSLSEFERLDEADRIRRDAKIRLQKIVSAVQAKAAKSGLTEAELDRLLSDES